MEQVHRFILLLLFLVGLASHLMDNHVKLEMKTNIALHMSNAIRLL